MYNGNNFDEYLNGIRPNRYAPVEFHNKPTDRKIMVSVIIPAYNAEKYIGECIESVIFQHTNFFYETIIINDGSSDSTLELARAYEESTANAYNSNSSNCFIKVIDQENRGFSGARNRGLDEAVGSYVMFVDSDDVLSQNAITTLLTTATRFSCGIVQGGYIRFGEEEGTVTYHPHYIKPSDLAGKMALTGFVWDKIYNRKIFENIRFPEGLLFEDTILHMLIFELCGKVAVVPDVVYNYRVNHDSISFNHTKDNRSVDSVYIVKALLEMRRDLGLPLNAPVYRFLLFQLSAMMYGRIRTLDREVVKACFEAASAIVVKELSDYDDFSPNFRRGLNAYQKLTETALLTSNFNKWYILSRLDHRINKLSSF